MGHKFSESTVLHLPKVGSDHRPVLVWFDRVVKEATGIKSFRFQAA